MDIHRLRDVEPRRHAGGYCVEGPGFYVWDEDPREVSRLARDLARGAGAATPEPAPLSSQTDGQPGQT